MADEVRVFVSHHHSPEEDIFTARLVADLEAAGADVWVDDQRITSDDFIKKINEGLAGRQWLVLVMTPSALRSAWVQAEVNAALNQVRKGRMLGVVPVVAKSCDDGDIPPLLDALHRYDATRAYDPARDGLLHALGLSAAVPSQSGTLPRQTTPQATPQATPDELHRRAVLQGLLRDVEHDRDALSAFLYHVQLGDESGHVISEAGGLDIWRDGVLATRTLPHLLANRNVDGVRKLRYTFSPQLNIQTALRTLLYRYARLSYFQRALAEELAQGEGRDLWRDYQAWEEADKLHNANPVSLWQEREQLSNRWYAFKSTSPISRKREECMRAFVEAREQCEVIMSMVTEELRPGLWSSEG